MDAVEMFPDQIIEQLSAMELCAILLAGLFVVLSFRIILNEEVLLMY